MNTISQDIKQTGTESARTMSRAVCIPFHRYVPHVDNDHYKVYAEYLLTQVGEWDIDKLYLIDSDMNFDDDYRKRLGALVDYQIIPREKQGHHWVQYKTALPHIKEDLCLFLDNDVIIKKPGIIDTWFTLATPGGFLTAFDSSGGLREKIHERFPIMAELDATRMGSYYFVAGRQVMDMMMEHPLEPIYYHPRTRIEELDYGTLPGDWSDSFGFLTIKILAANITVVGISDPRDSVYYSVPGGYQKVPLQPENIGYYHIRNGNLPVYMMDSEGEHREHVLKITPRQEAMRVLAWWYYCSRQIGKNYDAPVKKLLHELDVKWKDWVEYCNYFMEYHKL